MAENEGVLSNIQPIERASIPVGTIQEAEAEGLDPTVYPTCARPNKVTGVVGCEWFHKCIVSAKGVAGPKNYGVEVVKGRSQGGGFSKFNTSCTWIADHAENYAKNGGALKVIAEEGGKYETVQTISVDALTGKPCNQKAPNAVRRKTRVEVEVPKYPRPGESPALLVDVLRAESIEAEGKRRQDEAAARAYGLEHTIAPIDKRDAGSGKGRSQAGRGGSEG